VHRTVLNVDADHCPGVAAHVLPGAAEEAARADAVVALDVHVGERQRGVRDLDKTLDRVGELGHQVDLQRGVATEGAESAGRVVDIGATEALNHVGAEALQVALQAAEFVDAAGVAVAHDHVGIALDDWLDERRDRAGVVLVIGIGVHHDVGTELECGIDAAWNALARPWFWVKRTT